MNMFISPNKTPYLIDGMKDGKTLKVIQQDISQGGSIPIYRSRDQNNGIEMTWSTWIYIDDPTYNQTSQTSSVNTVFVKGTNGGLTVNTRNNTSSIFNSSNAPGVYLQASNPINDNTYNPASGSLSMPNLTTMNLLIVLDIFPYTDPNTSQKIYKQEIVIENFPIKKWVSLIIRCSTQNIVDIFINGSLQQRVKLYNIIRQNYENVYINPNGGYDGFLSNLRYFDYSIGTFEINQIVSSGPNLKMEDSSNIKHSSPYYLSTKWLFGEQSG